MKTRSIFGRHPLFIMDGMSCSKNEICFADRVAYGPPAIGRGKIELVRDRGAPIGAALKRCQAIAHAQNAANIGSVTIGIPAARVDNGLRFAEIALTVKQTENDQPVVRNNMAVAAILVIAIMSGELGAGRMPIRGVCDMPVADVGNEPVDH